MQLDNGNTVKVGHHKRSSKIYEQLEEEGRGHPRCLCIKGTDSKNRWDLWIGFLIVYTALFAPYRLSFETKPEGWLFVFELSMDMFFLIDLTFSFNTAFQDSESGQWITSRSAIAKNYLKGWFWIDFPASIPVDGIEYFMINVMHEEMEGDQLHIMRLLRLLRLARVIRLLKIGDLLNAIEEAFGINLGWMQIIKMGFGLMYLTHAIGCCWHAVGSGYHDTYGISWIEDYHGTIAAEVELEALYVSSVYWAITTLTTVGYGDICPTNYIETSFTMCTFMMGVVCFGYLMGSMGGIIDSLDKKSVNTQDKMGIVKQYVEYRNFPRALALRLRRFYQNFYDKSAYLYNEKELLSLLTPGLRHRAQAHILDGLIGPIVFFKNFPMDFNQQLLQYLQPSEVRPNDVIFTRGDDARSVYWIQKGSVGLFTGTSSESSSTPIFTVTEGGAFGEEAMLGMGRRPFMAQCVKFAHLVSIPGNKLQMVRDEMPSIGDRMHEQLLAITLRRQRQLHNALSVCIAAMPKENLQRNALVLQLCWFKFLERKALKREAEVKLWNESENGTTESRLVRVEMKLRQLSKVSQLNEKVDTMQEIIRNLVDDINDIALQDGSKGVSKLFKKGR